MGNGFRIYQKSFIAHIILGNFDQFQWIKIKN